MPRIKYSTRTHRRVFVGSNYWSERSGHWRRRKPTTQKKYPVKIKTKADLRKLLHPELFDGPLLRQKKTGARLVFAIFFQEKFYERAIKKACKIIRKLFYLNKNNRSFKRHYGLFYHEKA